MDRAYTRRRGYEDRGDRRRVSRPGGYQTMQRGQQRGGRVLRKDRQGRRHLGLRARDRQGRLRPTHTLQHVRQLEVGVYTNFFFFYSVLRIISV